MGMQGRKKEMMGRWLLSKKGRLRSFGFMMSAGNRDGIVGDLWWRRWGWFE